MKGIGVGVTIVAIFLVLGVAVGASTGWLSREVNNGRPHVGEVQQNLSPAEQAGKDIAMTTCISCHGSDLKGGVGPSLYKKSQELSQAQIEDVLKNGFNGRMPAGLVPADKIANVAAYIKSLSKVQTASQ